MRYFVGVSSALLPAETALKRDKKTTMREVIILVVFFCFENIPKLIKTIKSIKCLNLKSKNIFNGL